MSMPRWSFVHIIIAPRVIKFPDTFGDIHFAILDPDDVVEPHGVVAEHQTKRAAPSFAPRCRQRILKGFVHG
jgi:hypothetical protein